ncbi:LytTR family DNA-binding domain-containing protein [Clostridium tagluense]|uniref:LytR/AlgR family response regulator transcription factor n=1 Tax=Clostridium tagluense TaxID=360422 RepID=UPI001C0DA827|nr:LytTR family DNA-binding domain-containing protein [Clostridium tagluense]MBU3129260.1 LytTR family DNA-binding domain-containing protein [Clostridium tagluense]MCB2310251.1 LytTR family DNA-binding domain-containing protein [Clostridium tagluense]MCB2315107.1 LytTR family DNA-binding domain-containing protein [Clostridium tagluense]MCB2319951.1 LytTR family DNA-binding domain-containing protein [Clostridium tagluense]MCB2324850.1 LytTR family DNA-binding domain-containing protein [Clostrid
MNCIIVDDEFPSREELKYFINNFSNIKIMEEFDDSIIALEYIELNKPDIIFLDINMPKLDGMALGKIISHFPQKSLVIFITAHKDYAVDAFEIQAYDYILKPYSEERIVSTLKKIEKGSDEKFTNSKITLWKDNKMIVRSITQISYCEAKERETLIYINGEQYNVSCSISEFYKKLPKEFFFRSHRSYIINIDKILEIVPWFNNTYMLKIQGENVDIPVSRNNIIEFKHIMGI